jgi:hypothetical protein
MTRRPIYDPTTDLAGFRAEATPERQALVDERGRRLAWGELPPAV